MSHIKITTHYIQKSFVITTLNRGIFKNICPDYIIKECFQSMGRDLNLGRDVVLRVCRNKLMNLFITTLHNHYN
jgi:hypothetical protein